MADLLLKHLRPVNGEEDDPEFAGKIRVTDDGRISVFDAMAAIGMSNPRVYLKNLQSTNEEVVNFLYNWKFPGARQRDTPVTDRQGLTRILMLLPGKIAAKFREKVSVLLERYLNADRTLAEDILRRADAASGVAVANLDEHPRITSSWSTRELNDSIKEYMDKHKGCGMLYPTVHDTNNLAVTGKTATQLRAVYNARGSSRDLQSRIQAAAMTFMQLSEADEIKRTDENPVLVSKRSRESMEPLFKARGLHDSRVDVACIQENQKVMRLKQKEEREAKRICA